MNFETKYCTLASYDNSNLWIRLIKITKIILSFVNNVDWNCYKKMMDNSIPVLFGVALSLKSSSFSDTLSLSLLKYIIFKLILRH